MNTIKNYFKDWNLFEKTWLVISTLTILGLSLFWKDNFIGIVASITGIICVVLTAKGKIANYWFGIINVIAYAYVAYTQRFYGEVMLNVLYFLPMQFAGIRLWRKNKIDGTNMDVRTRRLSNKSRAVLIIVSIVATGIYGIVLKKMNGQLPFIDATSTVLSVIAMILMNSRHVEQWALWIVIDGVTIAMWLYAMVANGGNDISVLIMWVAYLINAIYGFINWAKVSRTSIEKGE